eukprot:Rmarinus@m.15805
MSGVFGFDLGNEACVIGTAQKGGIDIIANEVSRRRTSSIVGFGLKERYLGETGASNQMGNAKNTITEIKRLIGRKFDDPVLQEDLKWFPFKVVKDAKGYAAVQVFYNGETCVFTPQQVLAMLLVKLKETGLKETGVPPQFCVMSVPGFFTDEERRAVLDACAIADMPCLRLLNEHLALGISYGIYKQDMPENESFNVVFVDMGHSHTTCSAIAFSKGKCEVKAVTSDRDLGGRDFDRLLFNHFADEFGKKYRLDIRSNARARLRLLSAVVKLKHVLSSNPKGPINVECIMEDTDVSGSMHRDDLEKMAAPLCERIQAVVRKTIEAAGLTEEALHEVEVVGGAFRPPCVQTAIQSAVFGKKIKKTMNADEAVARGCALQAARESPTFRVREYTAVDIVPNSVHMMWDGASGRVDKDVFPQFSSAPSTKVITFNRDGPFEFEAAYGPESQLPPLTDRSLGCYKVDLPQQKETRVVHVKVSVDKNSLFEARSASIEEEIEVEVIEEPKEKDAKDAKAAGKDGEAEGAAATDAATDDKPADAPKEEPVKKFKKKRVEKTFPITVMRSFGMTTNDINAALEAEGKMASQDRLVSETADARNALEEYVLDTRSKVSCGDWQAYTPATVADSFVKVLTECEDWMYTEEGEDAPKGVLVEKLATLKVTGDPIAKRYLEAVLHRPQAIKSLKESVSKLKAAAGCEEERYAHIEPEKMQSVTTKCDEAIAWMEDMVCKQETKPACEDPVFLAADIIAKQQELEKHGWGVLSTPKPKPPEKTEEKADAPPEPPKDDASKAEMEVDEPAATPTAENNMEDA